MRGETKKPKKVQMPATKALKTVRSFIIVLFIFGRILDGAKPAQSQHKASILALT